MKQKRASSFWLAPTLATLLFWSLFVVELSFPSVGAWDKGIGPLLRSGVGLFYLSVLFALLAQGRVLFMVATPFLFVSTAATAFYINRYGVTINAEIMAALFSTRPADSLEFISEELVSWLMVAAGLSAALVWLHHRAAPCRYPLRHRLVALGLLWLALLIVMRVIDYPATHWLSPFNATVIKNPADTAETIRLARQLWGTAPLGRVEKKITKKGRIRFEVTNQKNGDRLRLYAGRGDFAISSGATTRFYDRTGRHRQTHSEYDPFLAGLSPRNFLPFTLLGALADFGAYRIAMANASATLIDISRPPSTIDDTVARDLVVILIVGESARADHFGLNGYPRPTSPLLAKEKGLISFTAVTSCAASTAISLPCMLTRMTVASLPEAYAESHQKDYIYDQIATENSFISLFRKHGFATGWFSLSYLLGRKNAPISLMLRDAETIQFRTDVESSYREAKDEILLGKLDTFLTTHSGRAMIALHTRGSHWSYARRYPEKFRRFTPDCQKRAPYECDPTTLTNAYDNTILYTDWFITKVISRVRNRNALVIYTSDHGESLGEEGVYTHSVMSRPEQRHVPMFWWTSPTYQERNQSRVSALKGAKNASLSHDNLFHSILDCAGIASEVIDTTLSLCHN